MCSYFYIYINSWIYHIFKLINFTLNSLQFSSLLSIFISKFPPYYFKVVAYISKLLVVCLTAKCSSHVHQDKISNINSIQSQWVSPSQIDFLLMQRPLQVALLNNPGCQEDVIKHRRISRVVHMAFQCLKREVIDTHHFHSHFLAQK